jgi:general secretion pathway protein C
LSVLNTNQILFLGVRGLKPLSVIVTIGLCLVIAWQLGVGVAQMLAQPTVLVLPNLQPVVAEQESVVKPKPILIWGTVPPAPVRQAPVSKPAPAPVVVEQAVRDTRLNVKLLGIIDAQPVGVAIIQTGRDTKVLSVGEVLQPNVTLVEIGRDFVILQNRGQRERLSMDDQTSGLLVSDSKTQAEPPSSQTSDVMRSGDGTNAMDQLAPEQAQQLLAVSSEVRQNPMKIGQYVRFEPMRERGEWQGIRIGARNHPEIFRALGFQEGDMVTSINGLSIAEMADNPTVWNQFLQESRFSLMVNRNGLEETIEVDLSN